MSARVLCIHAATQQGARWRQRSLSEWGSIRQLLRAGGPQMHTLHAFSFEREEWTTLRCSGGLPSWTFAHAVKHYDWLCARHSLSILCLARP